MIANPHPIRLERPPAARLTSVAQLGRAMFYDPALSASGQLSCASCHQPSTGYAPAGATPAHLAGSIAAVAPIRAVPGLRYLRRTPLFSIGPDDGVENVDLNRLASQAAGISRATKVAGGRASAPAMVPQGGLFWDGRASTLQDQAMGPLFNPGEMANHGLGSVSRTLRRSTYAAQIAALFGESVLADSVRLVDEAMFAVARYEVEDASFHPYSSRYDAWLEGKATLTDAEWRGLQAFEDPRRGNCAACHLDRPSPDGTPPRFTDDQYEALGVPRNTALAANADSAWFDLGVCGPVRADLAAQTQYCGMFHTPSLRNSATRTTFFHNGVYGSLEQVLRFYNLRATHPDSIYTVTTGGRRTFDDVPARYRVNVDTADAPFNRHAGARAPMTAQDMRDIIAFLRTLTDSDLVDASAH